MKIVIIGSEGQLGSELVDTFQSCNNTVIGLSHKEINIEDNQSVKNGIAYVFEINARFSTTNSVRAASGYNEVELLVDHFITGKKKYITHYKKLTAMAYLNYAFIKSESLNEFKKQKSTIINAEIENVL